MSARFRQCAGSCPVQHHRNAFFRVEPRIGEQLGPDIGDFFPREVGGRSADRVRDFFPARLRTLSGTTLVLIPPSIVPTTSVGDTMPGTSV